MGKIIHEVKSYIEFSVFPILLIALFGQIYRLLGWMGMAAVAFAISCLAIWAATGRRFGPRLALRSLKTSNLHTRALLLHTTFEDLLSDRALESQAELKISVDHFFYSGFLRHRHKSDEKNIRSFYRMHRDAADTARSQGRFNGALRSYVRELLPLAQRSGDTRLVVEALENIAGLLQARAAMDKELFFYRKSAIANFQKLGGELPLQINSFSRHDEDLSRALSLCRTFLLPEYKRLRDEGGNARVLSIVVNILQLQNNFKGALQLCSTEVLPIFEKIGDKFAYANALMQIASIRTDLNELDESLQILQSNVLVVLDDFGEEHFRTEALSRIAGVAVLLGKKAEALSIYRNDVLPAYVSVADLGGRARTWRRIAEIMVASGDLDEALRIYCDEVLHLYENLRDAQHWTIVRGEIARILALRGDVVEALGIYRDDVLAPDNSVTTSDPRYL